MTSYHPNIRTSPSASSRSGIWRWRAALDDDGLGSCRRSVSCLVGAWLIAGVGADPRGWRCAPGGLVTAATSAAARSRWGTNEPRRHGRDLRAASACAGTKSAGTFICGTLSWKPKHDSAAARPAQGSRHDLPRRTSCRIMFWSDPQNTHRKVVRAQIWARKAMVGVAATLLCRYALPLRKPLTAAT